MNSENPLKDRNNLFGSEEENFKANRKVFDQQKDKTLKPEMTFGQSKVTYLSSSH